MPRMKLAAMVACLMLGSVFPAVAVASQWRWNSRGAGSGKDAGSPVTMVVSLLSELESTIEKNGKLEQKSYDEYACWCEDALGRKAADIKKSKKTIDDLGVLIIKLKAEIASHEAEIAQLTKDIAGNIEATRDATEARQKEYADFENEKLESEQCIGALEAAGKVLAGAGTGKKGFLETIQEAQLLDVVSGLKRVMRRPSVSRTVSMQDMNVLQRFIDKPDDFLSPKSEVLTATQIAHNPFGDYAPQSTQIQGIIKSMYDSFSLGLEKDNAEEAASQKAYEALMNTKKMELATLQLTLEQQSVDKADKVKKVAESKALLDDTKEQLKADEAFFDTTKKTCSQKAEEWAERVRLRTEELNGVAKAIEVLSNPDAVATFHNSSTTFIQLRSSKRSSPALLEETTPEVQKIVSLLDLSDVQKRSGAYAKLKSLATTFKSKHLAEMAVQVKNGGHFDKMITIIDDMITMLRTEEAEDLAHRQRCNNAQAKNKNDMDDAQHDKEKAETDSQRLKDEAKELKDKIADLEKEIKANEKDMDELKELRNKEEADFRQALKDDADAVQLLAEAIDFLTKFYRDNKMPILLSVNKTGQPEYSQDPDAPPQLVYEGKGYSGSRTETGGLVAIITMIREDTKREMIAARKEEKAAVEEYLDSRADLQKVLDSNTMSKITLEKDLSDTDKMIAAMDKAISLKGNDLAAGGEVTKALLKDCAWVETHFESRRDQRKDEIAGLQEAKSYLAGVDSGTEVAP